MSDSAFSHNQQILEDLEWAIDANDSEFELILVRYDYVLLRERFFEQWRNNTELNLLELKLGQGDRQFLERVQIELNIRKKEGNGLPKGLIVSGFEQVDKPDDFLVDLNQSRDELKNLCPFPLVFVGNGQLLQMIAEQAKDLRNWATPPMRLQMPATLFAEDLEKKFTSLLNHIIGNDLAWEFLAIYFDFHLGEQSFNAELDGIQDALDQDKIQLTSEQQGYLAFLQGRRYRKTNLDKALEFYGQAIAYFRGDDFKVALAELYRAEVFHSVRDYPAAKAIFEEFLYDFESEIDDYFWVVFANKYGECLRYLGEWETLESLANRQSELIKDTSDIRVKAFVLSLLGQVDIHNKNYEQAVGRLETLLALREIPQEDTEYIELYGVLLAIACEYEGNHQKSWDAWLRALQFTDFYGEDLDYLFELIEKLYGLYFDKEFFVDAYRVKLEWRSLEQQYGKIAFVGASRLKPLRRLKQDSRQDEFSASGRQGNVQWIMERLSRPKHKLTVLYGQSGVGKSSMIDAGLLPAIKRKKFINNRDLQPILVRNYGDWQGAITDFIPPLLRRVRGDHTQLQQTKNSSAESSELGSPPAPLVEGGSLEKNLQQPTSFLGEGDRRAEGVSVGDATHEGSPPAPFWKGGEDQDPQPTDSSFLGEGAEGGRGSRNLSQPTPNPSQEGNQLLQNLKQIADQDNLVILIFDQFEEFFFTVKDPRSQRQFFEFLRDCLNIPFIKVILSLREDYLHLLLQGTRNLDLGAIDNNLLHRDIIHYIGNFSPEGAKGVIQYLTAGSEVAFTEGLIDTLIADLTTDLEEVRPIELQIVGQQIQREIHTRDDYLALATDEESPKEVLIDRYLVEAIKDCGEPNEQIARLILYYLTDEDEHKVLKSLTELESDLAQWQEKFAIREGQIAETVEILVMSGLVVEILEPEFSQYQLVHDYLIRPIRKSQTSTIEELQTALNQERFKNRQLKAEKSKIEDEIKSALTTKEELEIENSQNERRVQRSKVAFNIFSFLTAAMVGGFVWSGQRLFAQKKELELSRSKVTEAENLRKSAEEQAVHLAEQTEASRAELRDAQDDLDIAQKDQRKAQEEVENARIELEKVSQQEKVANEKVLAAEKKLIDAEVTLKTAQEAVEQAEQLREFAQLGTKLEREASSADRVFEFQNLEGLLLSLKTNFKLKNTVNRNDFGEIDSINKYPTVRPILSLQEMFNKSKTGFVEHNQLSGHSDYISSVKFSPDGKTIATGSKDETLRLWTRSGQKLNEWQADLGVTSTYGDWGWTELGVTSVDFSPDGKTIVTGSDDGKVRLWNLEGEMLRVFSGHTKGVNNVSFSPKENKVASAASDGTIRLWDLSGKQLTFLSSNSESVRSLLPFNVSGLVPSDILFSPDGKTLGVTLGIHTILWNHVSNEVESLGSESLGSRATMLDFSSDGKIIATASLRNRQVALWTISGKKLAEFDADETVRSIQFHPKEAVIALGLRNGAIQLFEFELSTLIDLDGQINMYIEGWRELQILRGHSSMVRSIDFSADGQILISASDTSDDVRLWKHSSNEVQTELWSVDDFDEPLGSETKYTAANHQLSFSIDGESVFSVIGDQVSQFSLLGETIQSKKIDSSLYAHSIRLSMATQSIVIGGRDGTIFIRDSSGKESVFRNDHLLDNHYFWTEYIVKNLAFSSDGKTIAGSFESGTIWLWNSTGEVIQSLNGHELPVNNVRFSPHDDRLLASASDDGTVRLWNRSGQELQVLRGHQSFVNDVSFSPHDDRLLASASDDGTVRLWDRSGKELQVLRGHESGVWSVSFSPDGDTLASASDDGTVRLWNLSGEALQVLRGHESGVWSVSFSPDGDTLASATKEGIIRLWPVESLEDLLGRGCAWLEDYLRLYPDENKTDAGDILCEYPPR